MNSLHFEAACVPARTVSLHELLHEQFLKKNPPKDRSDRNNIIKAFEILLELFPNEDTATFSADHLTVFRNSLTERISEKTGEAFEIKYCNKLVKFVKAVFVWGMSPNLKVKSLADIIPPLVSPSLGYALSKVPLLQPGEARENKERDAVPADAINKLLSLLPPTYADIMRIQLLAGMRPGETCRMKVGDIRRTKEEFAEVSRLYDGEMWLYVQPDHKTKRYIGRKTIPLGVEEQEILGKYLGPDPSKPIFRGVRGGAVSGEMYSREVAETIELHGLPKFVPYEMRHTGLSQISLEHGRDAARAVAGHTTEAMTARYDHSDLEKAFEVVKERNRVYLAQRRAMGSDHPAGEVPTIRIFNGE